MISLKKIKLAYIYHYETLNKNINNFCIEIVNHNKDNNEIKSIVESFSIIIESEVIERINKKLLY